MFGVPAIEIRQYDGTNATEIVEWIEGRAGMSSSVASEVGGVLTLHSMIWGGTAEGNWEDDTVVNETDWVRRDDCPLIVVSDAVVQAQWVKVAE